MSRLAALGAIFAVIAAPAAAYSNAANYLIAEEIAAACNGGREHIDPGAVIERDLTGDGRADLIISHEGISRSGGGRSNACGSNAACLNDRMLRRLAELRSGGGGPAPVASGGVTGLYCARGGADSLVVRDHGGTADFEVLSIQGEGHSCGVEVRGAQRTAAGYVGSVEGCQLTLVPQGGEVVLLAAPFDACKMFCGARAALTEMHFPMSGRRALPGAYDSIGLGEVGCN